MIQQVLNGQKTTFEMNIRISGNKMMSIVMQNSVSGKIEYEEIALADFFHHFG